MTTTTDPIDCSEARMLAMAVLDREADAESELAVRTHLTSCQSCRAATTASQSTHHRLEQLTCLKTTLDLWPKVEAEILRGGSPSRSPSALRWLAALALTWRALQLVVELPLPLLQAAIFLVIVVGVLRWIASNPLEIIGSLSQLEQKG